MKDVESEMKGVESRNNTTKRYTVVFYLKIASSLTLGIMKQDHGLYAWLRSNNIWIRAFHFTTTYDVATTGFISHNQCTVVYITVTGLTISFRRP
jgi:hypothetical protein